MSSDRGQPTPNRCNHNASPNVDNLRPQKLFQAEEDDFGTEKWACGRGTRSVSGLICLRVVGPMWAWRPWLRRPLNRVALWTMHDDGTPPVAHHRLSDSIDAPQEPERPLATRRMTKRTQQPGLPLARQSGWSRAQIGGPQFARGRSSDGIPAGTPTKYRNTNTSASSHRSLRFMGHASPVGRLRRSSHLDQSSWTMTSELGHRSHRQTATVSM